jgi:hypothetical protein
MKCVHASYIFVPREYYILWRISNLILFYFHIFIEERNLMRTKTYL